MVQAPARESGRQDFPFPTNSESRKTCYRAKIHYARFVFLAAVILLSPLIFAQGNPQVTGVDPASGKVNDSVTVKGEMLGKESVSGVFFSDDKNDFKAAVQEQDADKIVVKVPQLKSGDYNISIQVGNQIFIKPVRFKVE